MVNIRYSFSLLLIILITIDLTPSDICMQIFLHVMRDKYGSCCAAKTTINPNPITGLGKQRFQKEE